jgi:cysteine synthase A
LVPDAASVAGMRFLTERTGLRAGASTGTNLYGALRLACELASLGEGGSIVSLLCDGAERYAGTYRNDAWLADRGWDLVPYEAVLAQAWDHGSWTG